MIEGFAFHSGVFSRPEFSDLSSLISTLPLEQTKIRVFGKEYPAPRLTAWMGSTPYVYSGILHEPAAMPSWLQELSKEVAEICNLDSGFNSVLANLYRDGKDSVAFHADDEPELGECPVIASVSFGSTRTFAVRAKKPHEQKYAHPCSTKWRVPLEHGDLLVMRGNSQRDYLHAVPKTTRPVGQRLNLTFRVCA